MLCTSSAMGTNVLPSCLVGGNGCSTDLKVIQSHYKRQSLDVVRGICVTSLSLIKHALEETARLQVFPTLNEKASSS